MHATCSQDKQEEEVVQASEGKHLFIMFLLTTCGIRMAVMCAKASDKCDKIQLLEMYRYSVLGIL